MDFPLCHRWPSVGEPKETIPSAGCIYPLLPEDKLRYLMGSIGRWLDGVLRVSIFDCVSADTHARNGRVMVPQGYLNLRNANRLPGICAR